MAILLIWGWFINILFCSGGYVGTYKSSGKHRNKQPEQVMRQDNGQDIPSLVQKFTQQQVSCEYLKI